MDLNQVTNYPKMTFEEMDGALRQAEAVIKLAESYRTRMARFLCGRLRGVNAGVLCALKKELRKFNAQTREWNDK